MKMKKMNKKGFTLVELLAVIVILAVIVLVAMNAVIPRMEEARRGAFKTEVVTFAKAAETFFTNKALSDPSVLTSGGCVELGTLKDGYVNKTDAAYEGSACVVDKVVYLAMTNGAYYYNGKVSGVSSSDIDSMIMEEDSSGSGIADGFVPSANISWDGTNYSVDNSAQTKLDDLTVDY